MIDTGKYEGHTPAPWRVEGELTEGDDNIGQSGDSTLSIHGDGLYIGEIGADYGIHETIANAQLMADAPLLLAEVNRLRERLIRAYDWVEKVVHGDDSVMADYTEYVCGDEEE